MHNFALACCVWYGLCREQASERKSPTVCKILQNLATQGFRLILFWGKFVGEADRRAPLGRKNATQPAITRPLCLPIQLPSLGINLPEHAGIPVLARADRRENTECMRQWSGHGIFSRGYRSKSFQLSFGSSSTKPVLLGTFMRRDHRKWCIYAPAHEQKSMSACTRAIKPRTKQGIGS